MLRKGDLTQGGITGTLLHFTLPMLVGSFLQQCYNIADTLIVGQCIGAGALAAVGSAYTLMVFLISVLLGLAMGSGTVFSLHYGAGNHVALRRSIFSSFVLIGIVTLILNVAGFRGVFSITPSPVSLEQAMQPEFAQENIRRTVEQICRIFF